MKKILEKSGKSQGNLWEEKSGNPAYIFLILLDTRFTNGPTICCQMSDHEDR